MDSSSFARGTKKQTLHNVDHMSPHDGARLNVANLGVFGKVSLRLETAIVACCMPSEGRLLTQLTETLTSMFKSGYCECTRNM